MITYTNTRINTRCYQLCDVNSSTLGTLVRIVALWLNTVLITRKPSPALGMHAFIHTWDENEWKAIKTENKGDSADYSAYTKRVSDSENIGRRRVNVWHMYICYRPRVVPFRRSSVLLCRSVGYGRVYCFQRCDGFEVSVAVTAIPMSFQRPDGRRECCRWGTFVGKIVVGMAPISWLKGDVLVLSYEVGGKEESIGRLLADQLSNSFYAADICMYVCMYV